MTPDSTDADFPTTDGLFYEIFTDDPTLVGAQTIEIQAVYDSRPSYPISYS